MSETKWPELEIAIEKLHLEPGDILVCKDSDAVEQLTKLQIPNVTFPVPIVYAPNGIQKMTREQLLKSIGDDSAPKTT